MLSVPYKQIAVCSKHALNKMVTPSTWGNLVSIVCQEKTRLNCL